MRAVVTYQHGGLDQMIYEPAYRDPVPGPGDVILRVRACTLNYHDVFTRKGMPGIKIPMPLIMGIDVAGEVVETGATHDIFEPPFKPYTEQLITSVPELRRDWLDDILRMRAAG